MAGQLQYDRGIRVTIHPPQELDGPTPALLVVNPKPPIPGKRSDPQLHVQFQVTKSLTPNPQPWVLRIMNLSQTRRDQIAGVVRSIADWLPADDIVAVDGVLRAGGNEVTATLAGMSAVRLDAGWSGALGQVFTGVAERVTGQWSGETHVLEIRGTDGGFNVKAAVASKVFAPGTPALAVLEYLASTLGLTVAPTAALAQVGGFTLVAGLNAQGDCQQGITDICDALQLQWWIEDGQVWILGDGESLPGQPVVVSPAYIPNVARLRRSPQPVDGGGLRIECALSTEIRVGHLVTLASAEQRGTYRVETVQHQGDNRGGPFSTIAVVRNPTQELLASL